MSRRPLIAGNWKMYKTPTEAVASARTLEGLVADVTDVDVMIAPPFTAIHPVAAALTKGVVAVGAQDLYWEKEGAYTSRIASGMLVDCGCTYVIIGHSECRQYFGETDETVNRKVKAAIDADLVPVMCIGESESERDAEKTFSVLDKQIRDGLKGFFSDDLVKLVIAYEPVWAIGTGKTATTEQAQEVHAWVRQLMTELFGNGLAAGLRILYGGSVKPDNAAALMAMPDIDGGLVGGASLDAETFSRIVTYQKS
jgi:triosephosphate isomerase